ncbi:glycosyltransferase family 2 protein [Elizabethkingia sp. JS20170427COW]|uniref:glycosyltransferase family 2 protein n=1 Tax=Elizabethkingia sp. JS20170427COW TaxID=2583851 RepID=UPI00111059DA|nr:glycosyltransferase family 2 protein [Elizabethkingia sp. JS20170427COW]QCX53426.1 glycosyltransferase family 2 protein [Elizabethkingia sp. JS20170427COW]
MQNKNPLVSVILSVYNAEKYIAKSIDSVLNQTFTDFEFLIVDDCSTDGTLAIIENKAQQDSRIKLINKEKNKGFQGYVENLNLMIQQAKGKYIAKFDADDIWVENKLEEQVKEIESHSDFFLLSANAIEIDENDNEIGKVIRPHTWEESQKMMLKNNPFCHPSILFRNIGYTYRQKMYYTEEYDLYLRMYSDGKKLIHKKDFLFYYRILKNSLSRGNKVIIQALFKQKAISFYHERIQSGKDSYDEFNPDDYLKIFDIKYPSSKEDLVKSLKIAFITGIRKDYDLLLKKALQQYGKKEFLKYIALGFIFPLAYQIYVKRS